MSFSQKYIHKEKWNSQKIKKVKSVIIKQVSYKSLYVKIWYMIALFWNCDISTSPLLALHCGDKIRKIRTSFKTLVSKKATTWWLKESQSNDKLLSKMSSSHHIHHIKNIHRASCIYNIHIGENFFCSCNF